MWVNFEDSRGEVNSYQDIDSLSKMIANSDKTRIIILIPKILHIVMITEIA